MKAASIEAAGDRSLNAARLLNDHMDERLVRTRRVFLKSGILIGGAALVGMHGMRGAEKEEEQVSPSEDLMREHGVLKRVLLIYDEAIRRMTANQEFPVETVVDSAKIIRSFIEDYHEKLEENFLFPRFEKAGQLTDLVKTLRDQHEAGRGVTDLTLNLATQKTLKNAAERPRLGNALRQFVRMYNPHEAREDTVLFPAFRKIVSANEYASLGEDFEKKEHELFGEEGFEKMVDKVTSIEKKLGIYELAQFTPKI
ncbi:MAG TPA: hemerythrin domain-containing protein [Chthoniobacterales bacterium]|nr:hemerythrin domain-containing protein [Chthoniobacterales bacterium]